jgi:transcriptional regulator with XRE-family HTH domain
MIFKKYRLKRGYTQEELAELLSMSSRNWQRIEKGELIPGIKLLKKIFKVLKFEDNDILKYMKN